MDKRGAVDLLPVVSSQLQLRTTGREQLSELRALARSQPGHWFGEQLTLLLAASVLETYLLHIRRSRLERFGLVRHPEEVTLSQLAALHRSHPGTAGQSFEIAIADSVNAGIPDVVDHIRKALTLLNVKNDGPIGMVLLGLEKVRPDDRQAVYDIVAQQLPSNGRLRSGTTGRPMSAQRALRRLSDLTWRSMRDDEIRQSDLAISGSPRSTVTQLGRADAFLYCGDSIVPVSMKIRSMDIDYQGWRDVPLWITMGLNRTTTRVRRNTFAASPTVIIELASLDFYSSVFRSTVLAVDTLLAGIDQDFKTQRSDSAQVLLLRRHLRPFANRPLRDALHHLRHAAHQDVVELFPHLMQTEGTVISMPLLNNPVIRQAFTDQALDQQLFTLQNHLWVRRDLTAWLPSEIGL